MLKSFITFLIHSTNEHGVHSPFVFNLITQCFYDKKKHAAYQTIADYRNNLLADNTTIMVADFGAGSRVFKNNERQVKLLAKHVGISPKRGKLLYRIGNYFQVENTLEIGTSLGIGTISLALSCKHVTTLEGCPETAKTALKYLNKNHIDNVSLTVGNFDTEIPKLIEKYDLIYMDGNHQQKATLSYFEQVLKLAHNDTIIILDDIHWSKEMETAWKIIYNDKRVSVSIDTFQWGIVSLRKEQEKEHFVIRI